MIQLRWCRRRLTRSFGLAGTQRPSRPSRICITSHGVPLIPYDTQAFRSIWSASHAAQRRHRPVTSTNQPSPHRTAPNQHRVLSHRPSDHPPPSPPSPTPHENIYNIPNLLTISRLVAAPVIGYLVLHDQHALAVGLFAYAGITDLLDGYIARHWNRRTVLGTVIDPMADKTLMTVLTICLAIKGSLPVWVASIILLRDLGLGVAAIYYRWVSLPPPKTFTRYWDFSLPSAEVRPTTISKYNTALQLALIGLTTASPLIPYDLGQTLPILQYVVAATTIWSGASYVFSKDAVKILGQAKKTKREN